jgi:hypothetical protein
MNENQIKRLKHDLKRPFSNLEMLIIILKGSEMDKERLVENLENILNEGKEAIRGIE